MDNRNTIGKILSRLEENLPFIEKDDIIETEKTQYPDYRLPSKEKNIILNGVSMTMPLASSKEAKAMLKTDKSPLLEVYKNLERGDILIVKETGPNKILVENLSVKDEYRKPFEIEKLDVIKGNFNVVKRKSIGLLKTLQELISDN